MQKGQATKTVKEMEEQALSKGTAKDAEAPAGCGDT
jgi:hypothetical protein